MLSPVENPFKLCSYKWNWKEENTMSNFFMACFRTIYKLDSLWQRANAWNVSFQSLYGGQFTLSTKRLYKIDLSATYISSSCFRGMNFMTAFLCQATADVEDTRLQGVISWRTCSREAKSSFRSISTHLNITPNEEFSLFAIACFCSLNSLLQ